MKSYNIYEREVLQMTYVCIPLAAVDNSTVILSTMISQKPVNSL